MKKLFKPSAMTMAELYAFAVSQEMEIAVAKFNGKHVEGQIATLTRTIGGNTQLICHFRCVDEDDGDSYWLFQSEA